MILSGQSPVKVRSTTYHSDRSTSPVNNSPLKGGSLSDAWSVDAIGQSSILTGGGVLDGSGRWRVTEETQRRKQSVLDLYAQGWSVDGYMNILDYATVLIARRDEMIRQDEISRYAKMWAAKPITTNETK